MVFICINCGALSEETMEQTLCRPSNCSSAVVNPYLHLGCPESTCWPRGFPLNDIHTAKCDSVNCAKENTNKIGILQSLADHEPDVDAIFRMTRETPLEFDKKKVY